MHILLTDLLSCPRCGPAFGLIVLADQMHDRRVAAGRLGCANCREEYPIRDYVADLRLAEPAASPAPTPDDEERAFRTAALLGLADRPGTVLIRGADPALVARVAALLPSARVAGASVAPVDPDAAAGLDWILEEGTLPFQNGSLAGVALFGEAALSDLGDLVRVLSGEGRVVLDPAPSDVAARADAAGLVLLLEQQGIAVASRSRPG